MANLPEDFDEFVSQVADSYDVPPSLALKLYKNGEMYNPNNNVSPKGARGPFQVMPDTFVGAASRAGIEKADINNPYHNAIAGVYYLKEQLDRFKNPVLATAAYNAGPGAVEKYKGVPPYKETQGYVSRIWGKMGDVLKPDEAEAAEIPSVPAQEPRYGPETITAPQPLIPGNIDYNTRPSVKNPDGTVSSVVGTGFGLEDGKEVLLPTIADDGRQMTPDEAWDQFKKTGKHLGIFKSKEDASAYAEQHHAEMGPNQAGQSVAPTDKTLLMKEAYRRGILPPDQKSMYEEAVKRGLIQDESIAPLAPPPEDFSVDQPQVPETGDERLTRLYGENIPGAPTQKELDSPELQKRLTTMARPVLSGTGAVVGGIAGTAAAGPSGAPLGAGLGYSIGERAADIVEGKPQSVKEALVQSVKDVATGGTTEMATMPGIKILQKGVGGLGNAVKQVLGRMSGTGTGAVETALKGSDDFTKALRGEITGDDVVKNAQNALSIIKDQRATAYQAKLAQISQNNPPIDTKPAWGKLKDLMDRYNIKVSPDGKVDTSRIAMGETGRRDIKAIIKKLQEWGTKPEDNTAIGLDTLKRQLDDFYSDSSQARQFVTSARNMVKDLIVKEVPQYAEMTKEYAQATKTIKDIEAGLMLRKQGMSGRIVADQTLRRLTSAMRDNFALRKDLVDILGEKAKEDLSGQIAGYSMNAWVPRGLSGTGPAIVGEAALAKYVSPYFWPVIVASSPRVQGEFLRVFGKGLAETSGLSVPVVKAIAYKSVSDSWQEKPGEEE